MLWSGSGGDGNVLSRSHEEVQLLNKTGSAMTACVCVCVCVYVCVSSLEFSVFLYAVQPSVGIRNHCVLMLSFYRCFCA